MEKLMVYHGRRMQMILKDDILYAQKARYGLDLKTPEGILAHDVERDRFIDSNNDNFLRCHDSFAVNKKHISVVEGSSIFLTNGEEIPVSRAYKKAVSEYIKYLRKLT